MNTETLRRTIPNGLAIIGLIVAVYGFLGEHIYRNIIISTGIFFMYLAWLEANLQKGLLEMNEEQWREKRKVLFAMSGVVLSGFILLCYYETKIPKYEIAIVDKELYRVPPQLSHSQLMELGKECNTYGNTRCSHDVFARIVKTNPRDYKSLANLAMAQSHLGFHTFAIKNFERVLDKGIRSYDVYKFYGHSLTALDEVSKALSAYKSSLSLNPNQASLRSKINLLKMSHSENTKHLSQ